MSSLLQFNGEISRKGVGLQFYTVVKDEPNWTKYNGPDAYKPSPDSTTFTEPNDTFTCQVCGRKHPRVSVAFRKPVGMFGPWVVFRYNGGEQVPDLSIPIPVFQLPIGARTLSDEESSKIWHS